jgi:hypothetical protein
MVTTVLTELPALLSSGWGWILLVLYLAWQGFSMKYIPNHEPLLAPIIEVNKRLKRISHLEQNQNDIKAAVEDLADLQESHVQVTRAQARALDDGNMASINSREVDKYLVKNGVAVENFLDHEDDK